jgi:hypothetical protein
LLISGANEERKENRQMLASAGQQSDFLFMAIASSSLFPLVRLDLLTLTFFAAGHSTSVRVHLNSATQYSVYQKTTQGK